jgi:7-carboxy-7-deazaguanine synthase
MHDCRMLQAMNERIRVSEIFGPTIQGEGPLIGRPTLFVRTGGCDYRCIWCDTLYAVLPAYRSEWKFMTAPEILARVNLLAGGKPILVTLSGGNPALQPLESLIRLGRCHGHTFALETQGSMAQPWLAELDWIVFSPKAPSSGIETDWNAFEACLRAARGQPRCALKIVIFDDADYGFARHVSARYSALPVYLQVGNSAPFAPIERAVNEASDVHRLLKRFRWLAEKVTSDHWFDATVLPQLHVLAWGNKRGV